MKNHDRSLSEYRMYCPDTDHDDGDPAVVPRDPLDDDVDRRGDQGAGGGEGPVHDAEDRLPRLHPGLRPAQH
jgi:hypothetical protein